MAGRAKKKCLFEDDVRAMLGMPKIDFQDEDTTLEKKLANGHPMQVHTGLFLPQRCVAQPRRVRDACGIRGRDCAESARACSECGCESVRVCLHRPCARTLFSCSSAQMRGSDDDEDDEGWRASLCRGKNGVCLVLVLMCAAAAVVLGMELRQASQAADRVGGVTKVSVTYVGGRGRGDYHPRRSRAVRGSSEIRGRKRAQEGHEAEVVTRHNWKALQDKADRERMERKGETQVGGQREEMKEEDAFRRSGGARGSVKAHQVVLLL